MVISLAWQYCTIRKRQYIQYFKSVYLSQNTKCDKLVSFLKQVTNIAQQYGRSDLAATLLRLLLQNTTISWLKKHVAAAMQIII